MHHDYLSRVIHFVIGAVAGLAIGLGSWLVWFSDSTPAWIALGVPAVLIGVIAAMFGDSFWRNIGSHWWPW